MMRLKVLSSRPGWTPTLVCVGSATLAGVMQLFRTRQWRIIGDIPFTLDFLLFAGVIVVCLVPALRRFRDLCLTGWLVVGVGAFFFLYVLLSTLNHPLPSVFTSSLYEVPLPFLLAPPVHAMLCMLAALCLVLALGHHRRVALVTAAGALIVFGFIAWPRLVSVNRSWRLATALGGSATVHVAYLIATAILLGYCLTRHSRGDPRQRWTPLLWVLTALGVAGVLATGSRAGLLCLVVWLLILALLRAHRLVMFGAIALALLWGVLLLALPDLRHSLITEDPLRQTNAASALGWWMQDLGTVLLGTGPGQVWPWVSFDAGLVPAPGDGMIPTDHGPVLLSPHSTLLAVAVESGLILLLVTLTIPAVMIARLVTARKDPFLLILASATLALSLAFLFDTYLVKEFSVSFWWWLAVFTIFVKTPPGPDGRGSRPGQQQHQKC